MGASPTNAAQNTAAMTGLFNHAGGESSASASARLHVNLPPEPSSFQKRIDQYNALRPGDADHQGRSSMRLARSRCTRSARDVATAGKSAARRGPARAPIGLTGRREDQRGSAGGERARSDRPSRTCRYGDRGSEDVSRPRRSLVGRSRLVKPIGALVSQRRFHERGRGALWRPPGRPRCSRVRLAQRGVVSLSAL